MTTTFRLWKSQTQEAWLLAIARYKALSAQRHRTDAELNEATVKTRMF